MKKQIINDNVVDSYDSLSDKMDYHIAPKMRNKPMLKIILKMVGVMMGIAILMNF